jgi:hypothetical protein
LGTIQCCQNLITVPADFPSRKDLGLSMPHLHTKAVFAKHLTQLWGNAANVHIKPGLGVPARKEGHGFLGACAQIPGHLRAAYPPAKVWQPWRQPCLSTGGPRQLSMKATGHHQLYHPPGGVGKTWGHPGLKASWDGRAQDPNVLPHPDPQPPPT